MNLSARDVRRLVCPECHGPLSWRGREDPGALANGTLRCGQCAAAWPLQDGVPRLFRRAAIGGSDRVLGLFYDHLPGLHDPVTEHVTFRLLQGSSLADVRDHYMKRLELESLEPRPDGEPVRILEVGVGTGANLPLISRALPRGLPVEMWGLDLSPGMLAECRKRLRREPRPGVRLLLGDVHSLPFPDHTFDRVLETGGTGGFRDPSRAVREMIRVARPGARLVMVDEQLDSSRPQPLLHRALFRLITFYSREARSPRALLPPGVTGLLDEQLSRYYYCLSFWAPADSAAG